MRNARRCRRNRAVAPAVEDVLDGRQDGLTFAEIGASFGCLERTVRAALDRYADRGQVPPVAVFALHPGDGVARRRLFERIRAAHLRGVPVRGWEAVEEARQRFGDGREGYLP